jgi:hypothetical protein
MTANNAAYLIDFNIFHYICFLIDGDESFRVSKVLQLAISGNISHDLPSFQMLLIGFYRVTKHRMKDK